MGAHIALVVMLLLEKMTYCRKMHCSRQNGMKKRIKSMQVKCQFAVGESTGGDAPNAVLNGKPLRTIEPMVLLLLVAQNVLWKRRHPTLNKLFSIS